MTLQARAVVLDNPPGTPPSRSGDYDPDAIVDARIEPEIVYFSGRARNGFKPVGLPAGR